MDNITFDFDTLPVDPNFLKDDVVYIPATGGELADRSKSHIRIKKKLKECIKYLSKHRQVVAEQYYDQEEFVDDEEIIDEDAEKDDRTSEDMTRDADIDLATGEDQDDDDETKMTGDLDEDHKAFDVTPDLPKPDDATIDDQEPRDDAESLFEFGADVFIRHDYLEFRHRTVRDRFIFFRDAMNHLDFGDCSDLGLGDDL